MLVIYFLIYGVMFGLLSSVIVKGKNRDQSSWFLIGFFFGLFGFIAAAVVDKIDGDPQSGKLPEKLFVPTATDFNPSALSKVCPDCAESIKLQARICRFCKYRFSDEDVTDDVRSAHRNWMTESGAGTNEIRYCNFCGATTEENFGNPPYVVCKKCSM
jgi:hypothetical protein